LLSLNDIHPDFADGGFHTPGFRQLITKGDPPKRSSEDPEEEDEGELLGIVQSMDLSREFRAVDALAEGAKLVVEPSK